MAGAPSHRLAVSVLESDGVRELSDSRVRCADPPRREQEGRTPAKPLGAADAQRQKVLGTFPHGSERAAPLGVASGRFDLLDGWRGICALLVALYHLRLDGYAYDLPAVRNAYLFVDFFFVLSGFVISHAYSSKVASFRNILVFVVRRFGRCGRCTWLS
jgi:hypothetical protein